VVSEGRSALLALPRRWCEDLAVEHDPKQIYSLLKSEVLRILRNLANGTEEIKRNLSKKTTGGKKDEK
jgi:hypothetical protein